MTIKKELKEEAKTMNVIIVYTVEDFVKALHKLVPHTWLIWVDISGETHDGKEKQGEKD